MQRFAQLNVPLSFQFEKKTLISLYKTNTMMLKNIFKVINVFLLLLLTQSGCAQKKNYPLIHSHNDYYQKIPFWQAYSCGLNSIEIDVFLKNDSLFVAHSASEIIRNRDIESLYLKPLQNALELGFRSDLPLQLLIDIKSNAKSTSSLSD